MGDVFCPKFDQLIWVKNMCRNLTQTYGGTIIVTPSKLGGVLPGFFDMSSASGYMGATYFQEFGPMFFFDMSSTSGNMGAKYVQEFGPRFLACHVPNLACHGVPISCVSINSVSCHVIILRVSVSVPCRGYPAH